MPASLLVWILLLALDLHAMLGARISSGWILTGVMFSLSALFILWMLSEIVSALHTQVVTHESLRGVRTRLRGGEAPRDMDAWLAGKDRFDFAAFEAKRRTLGLKPCHIHANRMRRVH